MASNSEKSGVWSYLPNNHSKIYRSIYLTHFSSQNEIDQTINLFTQNNSCEPKLGLIIIANNWGAEVGRRLADKYFKTCNRMADMFFMIDGIKKPTILPYSNQIISNNCINYYQQESFIHGETINNCLNISVKTNKPNTLMKAHVSIEWVASRKINQIIYQYFDQKFLTNLPTEIDFYNP